MAFAGAEGDAAPLLLLLADSDNRASERWLTRWEAGFPATQRVTLESWSDPQPAQWANRLSEDIQTADRPVVLVTQGLACLAVAWWVEHERPAASHPVRAAIFHDPAVPSAHAPAPYPLVIMPFPACVLASPGRGAAELNGLRRLARGWYCHFDTMAAQAVPLPKAFRPVQSLGERFLAQVTIAPFSMRPAPAQAEMQAGYPVAPRER